MQELIYKIGKHKLWKKHTRLVGVVQAEKIIVSVGTISTFRHPP